MKKLRTVQARRDVSLAHICIIKTMKAKMYYLSLVWCLLYANSSPVTVGYQQIDAFSQIVPTAAAVNLHESLVL